MAPYPVHAWRAVSRARLPLSVVELKSYPKHRAKFRYRKVRIGNVEGQTCFLSSFLNPGHSYVHGALEQPGASTLLIPQPVSPHEFIRIVKPVGTVCPL